MSKKKKKAEKEPNLKLSLAATIFLIVLILFSLIDTVKNMDSGTSVVNIVMTAFMVGCLLALLWAVWFIIKRIKAERQ